MCVHRIPLIVSPSQALALALGASDLPGLKALVLPALDISRGSQITEKDIREIRRLLRDELRKDKARSERRYPGLELLLKHPADDVQLGAGDDPARQQAFSSIQGLFSDRARQHTEDLYQGDINLDQWREAVRGEIKALHVNGGVAAFDGRWNELTFSDWGRIGNRVGREYAFLDQTAQKIEAGDVSEKWVKASMDRYAETASSTFESAKLAYVGIDPGILGYYPGDGTTVCRSNCKCRWNIRVISKRRGDFNATWMLGSVEDHCSTCLSRHRSWRSVKIRGGVLQEPLDPIVR